MTMFWESLALLALGWVFFAFAGYPLSLKLLSRVRSRPVETGEAHSTLSPTPAQP